MHFHSSRLGVQRDMAPTHLNASAPQHAAIGAIIAMQVAVATLIVGPALVHLGVAIPGQAGMADLPGTVNFHWLIQTHGVTAAMDSSLLMHPASLNRIILDGMPIDAWASWPLTAALGWPAGFTLFVWLCFALLGIATAWMTRVWWNSVPAAVVAGVVAQTHPFLIREVLYGRPTQVFGAIFLPLALGLTMRRLSTAGARWHGVAAGVAWGVGTLSYWFYGAYFFIGLSILIALAMLGNNRQWKTATVESLLGVLVITAVPIITVMGASEALPGQGLELASMVTHGDHQLSLRQLIEFRDLGASIASERALAAQILVMGLAIYGITRASKSQWLVPLLWLIAALWFAAGPAINLPGGFNIPGPFLIFDATDLTRRNWWPDRALVLAVPAVALLAGGGAAAVHARWNHIRPELTALAVCAAVVIEAYTVIPGLPMNTTWGAATSKTQQVAMGTGPTLILPLGTNGDQPDARMMIDQIHHGRPLVNGPMPFTSSTAPQAYVDNIRSDALQALVACEADPSSHQTARQDPWVALQAWNVHQVFLDPKLAERMQVSAARYRQCIAALLGPPSGGDPMLEYRSTR